MRYFISGHLDLTKEEFEEHYVPQLITAYQSGALEFLVGDARGCDFMAQRWLSKFNTQLETQAGIFGVPVTVYHMLEHPRHNFGSGRGSHDPNSIPSDRGFPTVGGFINDEDRDRAMTLASDADIAWVRPGRETSGTAKNLKRRIYE